MKPPGMTSFDVVAVLRKIYKIKKIGHTGTLDPGAVGVLPVCIGSATKAIEFMTEKDKIYRAELVLGVSTDTQDSSGEIIKTKEVNLSREQIIESVLSFIGKYEQVPPMYSAVKVGGKKLYELAREGITIERKPRKVEINSIDIVSIDLNKNKILFDIACSKGTYIRTLCADIGDRLGCGGHMSFLIRLKAGNFDISSAITFEELENIASQDRLAEALLNVESVFNDYTPVILEQPDEKRFLNGVLVDLKHRGCKAGEAVSVYSTEKRFIAIAEVILREGTLKLKSKKVF